MAVNLTDRQRELLLVYGSAALSCVLHYVVFAVAKYLTKITPWGFDSELVRKFRWPTFFITPIAVVLGLSNLLTQNPDELQTVRQIFTVLLIIAIAYLLCNLIRLTSNLLIEKNQLGSDNVHAKIAQTQVHVFRRMCYGFVVVISIACIFFTFPSAWQLGASLLASAGVLGIAIGVAAKPILENALASFIIALTRPILLDDEVFINNEYGRVESIRSTYIVVRTWDARRLVVPLTHVLTNIFENWSRVSPWKIGTVFLYVDPNVDVFTIREIFLNEALPESGDLWDGRVANLSVTDHSKTGLLELRLIASSKNTGTNFDLKAFIREYMIEEIRRRWPYALARSRVEIVPTLVETDSLSSIGGADDPGQSSYSHDDAASGKIATTYVRPTKSPAASITDKSVQKSPAHTIINATSYPRKPTGVDIPLLNLETDQHAAENYDNDDVIAYPSALQSLKNSTTPMGSKAAIAFPTAVRRKTRAVLFQTPISALCDTTIARSSDDPNRVDSDPIESCPVRDQHGPIDLEISQENSANDPHDVLIPFSQQSQSPSVVSSNIRNNPSATSSIKPKKHHVQTSKRKESIVNASRWLGQGISNLDSTTQMRYAEPYPTYDITSVDNTSHAKSPLFKSNFNLENSGSPAQSSFTLHTKKPSTIHHVKVPSSQKNVTINEPASLQRRNTIRTGQKGHPRSPSQEAAALGSSSHGAGNSDAYHTSGHDGMGGNGDA